LRIRRGVFTSVANLEDAIKRYIADHNRHAKPFVWTKTADDILNNQRMCITRSGKSRVIARSLNGRF
jgi:hypothetical protein